MKHQKLLTLIILSKVASLYIKNISCSVCTPFPYVPPGQIHVVDNELCNIHICSMNVLMFNKSVVLSKI